MSIELILYLIDVVSNVNGFLTVVLLTSALIIIAILFCAGMEYFDSCDNFSESSIAKALLYVKKYIGWWLLLLLISVFFPSEKTMYMMIGANVFKSSNLPPKIEAAIEKKLDEYLVEKKS
jgi:hypothetical protein